MGRSSIYRTGLVIAYVICMILPETWIASLHFGDVPAGSLILACACCLLFVQLVRNRSALSAGLVASFAALVLMTVHGYVRGNIETYSLKYFAADLYCFTAFLAGFAVSRLTSPANLARLPSRIAGVATAGLVITYAALFAGVVQAGIPVPDDRKVTSSIFEASTLLLILLPWASVARNSGGSRRLTSAMLVVSLVTGWLSGTRSIIILTLFAALLCWWLKQHRFDGPFFLRLTVSVALATALLVTGLPARTTALIARVAETQVADESRYVEVSMLWRQLADDAVAGQGMGSRFVSNVVIRGNPMASAPHIGIVTFLFKGGWLGFAAYAIAPSILALVLFFGPNHNVQRGAAASVFMFLATACLSGGWEPLPMLAYGMAVSATSSEWRRRSCLPVPRAVPVTRCESFT